MKTYLLATADASQLVTKEVESQVYHGITMIDFIKTFFIDNIGNILLGFIILLIGYNVSKFARAFMHRIFTASKYDKTVNTFISELVYYGLIFLTVITALGAWGVPQSSFVAIIGGLGLAIGLALQNNMSNFASGILILIFKPFRVGDWVQLSSNKLIEGSILRIELLYTVVLSKTHRSIYVPNSQMTSNALINSSIRPLCRLRFDVGISYDEDHHRAIEVLRSVFNRPHVVNQENLEIGITDFGDSSVTITAYPEFPMSKWREVYYGCMSDIKDKFDEANINMPYPQRDLHVYQMPKVQVEHNEAPIKKAKSNPVTSVKVTMADGSELPVEDKE